MHCKFRHTLAADGASGAPRLLYPKSQNSSQSEHTNLKQLPLADVPDRKTRDISHVCCEHGHRAEAAKGCAHLWQGEGPAALGAVLVVSKLIGEDLDSAHVQKSACRERREGRGQRPARKRCNRLGARHASGVRGQTPHPSGSAAAAIWRPKRIPPGVSSAKVTMTALALAAAIGLPPTLARETEVPSANAANALWAPTASIIDRASATTPIAMPSKDA